jgi:predicted acetyltransferase
MVDGLEEIRRLTHADIDEHLRLDEFAFQLEFTPERLQDLRAHTNPENIWGYFVDGQLAAQLMIWPLTVYVHGVPFPMGGIASVATWPEYRRGGKVAQLLRTSLIEMREAGQVVSMLAPFSFAFYRKYGWEMLMERKLYTLERADWPHFPDTGGTFERTTDWRHLAPIYEAYARRYNGMLQRTEEWWTRRIEQRKPGIRAVYRNAAGEPRGYLIYQVRNARIQIHELVFLDEDARRGIWNFIYNHDSMAREVTLVAPSDDSLPYLLDNPRIKQELEPYFMARIVDVGPFLRRYPFAAPDGDVTVALSLTDPHAPWNEKCFTICVDHHGAAEIEQGDARDVGTPPGSAHLPVVQMDIQNLSAMLMGYRRPMELYRLGRLLGNLEGVQRLEQILPARTTFLLDFF